MKQLLVFTILVMSLSTIVSCVNPNHSAKIKTKEADSTSKSLVDPGIDSVDLPPVEYADRDSSCLVVKDKTLCILKKYKIDLKNVRPFICQLKNGDVERYSWLTLGGVTLISILTDTNRGYTMLYAIDNKTQTLVKDEQFNRDYLTGFGIFVINGNKIFTMHKYYYNEKHDMRSTGSLYAIKKDRFVYIKSREEKNEISDDDTAIINFSRKSLNKRF